MKRIVVIGGGASGMMAAITAAREGARVCLLEANERVGKKLLATGNGRCNLTNLSIRSKDYSSDRPEMILPPGEVVELFRQMGLESYADLQGRVYPLSDSASSVLDVLRAALERHGAEVATQCKVASIKKSDAGFFVQAEDGQAFAAEGLVVASGSKAGSKHSGYGLLEGMGHTVTPLYPGLCAIETDQGLLSGLRGVRVKCKGALLDDGVALYEDEGELLFKDRELSGILSFDLSRWVPRAKGKCQVELDLLPQMREDELKAALRERMLLFAEGGVEGLFTGMLHKQLALMVAKRAGLFARAASGLDDGEIQRLAFTLKHLDFPVFGTAGWTAAQVAVGGVSLDEVHTDTMESRLVPGLYITGEALNMDGPCGGYNLHLAWSTGRLAGLAASAADEEKG